jgi:hypothetical protein
MRKFILILFMCILLGSCASESYKIVDSDGMSHYVDTYSVKQGCVIIYGGDMIICGNYKIVKLK